MDAAPSAAHDVEDFLTTFNRIERELKRRTDLADHEGFKTAAHRFVRAHRWWRQDFEAMMAFSDLRNVIVHERFDRFTYLSVPSPQVLDEIHAIHDRLSTPVRADEAFRREVLAANAADALSELLTSVRTHAFTQFPVYEEEAFAGLVTAAGIARWLAGQVIEDGGARVDFARRTVAEVLAFEEDRRNWAFMARDTPAAEVMDAFVDDPRLEAVLITEHGRQDQGLLGIATTSDAAAWEAAGDG